MTRTLAVAWVAFTLCGFTSQATAVVAPGQVAPNFTKTEQGTGVPRSLSDYSGKVVVLFEFGYNCPVCIGDGPSVEADLWQHYQGTSPGQVQVLGVDVWNGSEAQVAGFRSGTGVTFPLLLDGGTSAGGNLNLLYGPNDSYVVINKQGIVRFNAYPLYAHGDRYRLTEMRACIDSLVSQTVGVGDVPVTAAFALESHPNPFATAATLELVVPGPGGSHARVDIFDLAGRLVATPWDAPVGPGRTRFTWSPASSAAGSRFAAGIYLARASVGGVTLARRLVRAR